MVGFTRPNDHQGRQIKCYQRSIQAHCKKTFQHYTRETLPELRFVITTETPLIDDRKPPADPSIPVPLDIPEPVVPAQAPTAPSLDPSAPPFISNPSNTTNDSSEHAAVPDSDPHSTDSDPHSTTMRSPSPFGPHNFPPGPYRTPPIAAWNKGSARGPSTYSGHQGFQPSTFAPPNQQPVEPELQSYQHAIQPPIQHASNMFPMHSTQPPSQSQPYTPPSPPESVFRLPFLDYDLTDGPTYMQLLVNTYFDPKGFMRKDNVPKQNSLPIALWYNQLCRYGLTYGYYIPPY
jgi:hypothetical protein